jgi:hypothetical protein
MDDRLDETHEWAEPPSGWAIPPERRSLLSNSAVVSSLRPRASGEGFGLGVLVGLLSATFLVLLGAAAYASALSTMNIREVGHADASSARESGDSRAPGVAGARLPTEPIVWRAPTAAVGLSGKARHHARAPVSAAARRSGAGQRTRRTTSKGIFDRHSFATTARRER